MTGKSHLAAGACVLAQLHAADVYISAHAPSFITPLWERISAWSGFSTAPILCLTAFFIGTLFPDVDNKKSMLGRIIHIPVRHRTWIHAAYLYLGCLFLGTLHPAFLWFALGAFVHLFWDSFSPMGVCWFYKLLSDYREYPGGARVKKGFHITLYRSGEWTEYLVVFLLVTVSVAVVILTGKI